MLGVQHVERIVETTEATYYCGACGFAGPVQLAVSGTGVADSPLLLGVTSGAERAQKDARKEAKAATRLYLRLAACDKCGARDPAAKRRARLLALIPAVGAGLIASVLGAFVGLLAGGMYAGLVLGAVLVGGLFFRHEYKKLLRDADMWLVFLD